MICSREAAAIQRFLSAGSSISAASRAFGRSRTTINNLIARGYRSTYATKKTKLEVERRRKSVAKIAGKTTTKGHLKWKTYSSSRTIKFALKQEQGIEVSTRTIRRDLKRLRFRYLVRRCVPTRDLSENKIRKSFAMRARHISPKKIIFTDECWLTCNEATGRGQWTEEGKTPFPIEKKNRYNVATVQIWAAVGYNYRSELVFFPRKKKVESELKTWTLNGPDYVRRCLSTIRGKLQEKGVLLQQDGARAHANKVVKSYLKKQKIATLEPWPANSPDLNMIESVWAKLKAEIGRECPLTMEELVAAAKKAWAGIPTKTMNAHVMGFTGACERVLASP